MFRTTHPFSDPNAPLKCKLLGFNYFGFISEMHLEFDIKSYGTMDNPRVEIEYDRAKTPPGHLLFRSRWNKNKTKQKTSFFWRGFNIQE